MGKNYRGTYEEQERSKEAMFGSFIKKNKALLQMGSKILKCVASFSQYDPVNRSKERTGILNRDIALTWQW